MKASEKYLQKNLSQDICDEFSSALVEYIVYESDAKHYAQLKSLEDRIELVKKFGEASNYFTIIHLASYELNQLTTEYETLKKELGL